MPEPVSFCMSSQPSAFPRHAFFDFLGRDFEVTPPRPVKINCPAHQQISLLMRLAARLGILEQLKYR